MSHPTLLFSDTRVQIFNFDVERNSILLNSWDVGRSLVTLIKDRVEDRTERDESAIILTSSSESQRVHCPGKIGQHRGRGQGRMSDLPIIFHQAQPTFR